MLVYESEYCKEEEKERQQQSLGEDEELELEWTGDVGAGICSATESEIESLGCSKYQQCDFLLKEITELRCAPYGQRGAEEDCGNLTKTFDYFFVESFCYSVIFFFEIGHKHTCTKKFLTSVGESFYLSGPEPFFFFETWEVIVSHKKLYIRIHSWTWPSSLLCFSVRPLPGTVEEAASCFSRSINHHNNSQQEVHAIKEYECPQFLHAHSTCVLLVAHTAGDEGTLRASPSTFMNYLTI